MQETPVRFLINIWVAKIPWRRERLPIRVSWPREFYGLCSSWGFKESDITERLSLFIHKRQPRFMKVFCGGGSSVAPNPSVDDGSTSFCSVPLQFCIARHAGRMERKWWQSQKEPSTYLPPSLTSCVFETNYVVQQVITLILANLKTAGGTAIKDFLEEVIITS